MTKTAIIYARVSTVGQADGELPIDSQVEMCRKRATELGAGVLQEFIDAGISGRSGDRPAFQEAIAFCRINTVDYFVCWNTSRFARNRVDAPMLKHQLRKHGTEMIYVSVNLDASTKEGAMVEGMLEVLDEFYSRQVADDTTRSMMKNARDGHFNGGRAPFGYTVVMAGKRRRLEINELEASTVRSIFNDCVAGAGAKTIAINLNTRGLLRRGEPWSKPAITHLLRSWVYAGYIVFNRFDRRAKRERPESEWIKTAAHPAIIDADTFAKVQAIMDARAPRLGGGSHKSTHLFTGMLKCGACGRSMMIETATGRSKTYTYYNCAGSIKGLGCRPRRVPAGEMDAWLTDVVIDRVMSLSNLRVVAEEMHRSAGDWARERERRRTALVAELRDVERRRSRIYNLMETSRPEDLNLGDLSPRLRYFNTRALAIERSLSDLERQPAPQVDVSAIDLQELQDFVREVVRASNNPGKVRAFFAGFIEEIVLSGEDVKVCYRKDRLVTANQSETVRGKKEWLPDALLHRTARIIELLPERFRRAA